MTLHKTVEIAKKFLLGVILGIAAIFIFMLIFRLGVIIKNILFPPKTEAPNHLYGELPAISFPQNATSTSLTYDINTVTGDFPEFPDRLNVYTIEQPQPSLLNLNRAKEKVRKAGLINTTGGDIQEIALGGGRYVWIENTELGRRMTFDINNFDFVLESNFKLSPTVLGAKELPDKEEALNQTVRFLELLELMPNDIDKSKAEFEFLSIANGALVQETNPSRAHVVRTDLHQKNIEYNLNTGIPDLAGGFKEIKMSIPVTYSHPPYSTMSFWLGSGVQSSEVVEANFTYRSPILDGIDIATYYIKTSSEAFDELKSGKGYIATYVGPQTKIVINNIYLAYYLNETTNEYLMPVIVFEGDNGFVGYVSAIKTEWVK